MIQNLLLVGCGSFVGGALRYLLTRTVQNWIDGWMPAGTLAVNVLGCLLIGLFCGLSQEWMPQSLKLFLTVGFCGGFTTFSTFGNEMLTLMRTGEVMVFASYTLISVMGGIFLLYIGHQLATL